MAGRVTIGLRNPPDQSDCWQLALTDWNIITLIRDLSGRDYLDIGEVAAFDIPDGLMFPLRIVRLQIWKWNEDRTALIQLYFIQSMHPTLWDWDIGAYGDVPDPTYREVFIQSPGDYYFDVSTGIMAPIGVIPVAQDWLTPMVSMMMMVVMVSMIMPVLQGEG